MHTRVFRYIFGLVIALAVVGLAILPSSATAAEPIGDFHLQVTPSPIVTTLKPGLTTELELKIRNSGTQPEHLRIEPRSLSFSGKTEEIRLNDTTPPDIADWISFGSPDFTIKSGQWFTQKIRLSPPKDAGFSYSFALVITRVSTPDTPQNGGILKGSLAVFTLVNIDRPGASRKLEVAEFTSTQGVYEYLPAELRVQLKNSGNTIVQPFGNIFIQRSSNDTTPISTLPVNEKKGYILPGSVRTLETRWEKGFPAYKSVSAQDGSQKRQLAWDWAHLSELRIGRYTAKLVAVYNDGQRDIPVQGEIHFWVIPWKILLGLLFVSLLAIAGLWTCTRRIIRLFRKKKTSYHHS